MAQKIVLFNALWKGDIGVWVLLVSVFFVCRWSHALGLSLVRCSSDSEVRVEWQCAGATIGTLAGATIGTIRCASAFCSGSQARLLVELHVRVK